MAKIYRINGMELNKCNNPQNIKKDLPTELTRIIKEMKDEISARIHDTGYFRTFSVNFDKDFVPNFFGKNIALFVEKDLHQEGKAFLGVSVLHPTIVRDSRTYFINGNRQELLEYITKPEFCKELENTILELSEDLKKQR